MWALFALLLAAPAVGQAPPPDAPAGRFVVIQDGPEPTLDATAQAVVDEAQALFGPLEITREVGDFSPARAASLLQQALGQPDLRGVLTVGPVAAQAVANREPLSAPVVSVLGGPLAAHGVAEDDPRPWLSAGAGLAFAGDLVQLHALAPRVKEVRLVVPAPLAAALPALETYLEGVSRSQPLPVRALSVPPAGLSEALDSLDAGAALYVGLPTDPSALDTQALIEAARRARVPVVAGVRQEDVSRGALLSVVPATAGTLRARLGVLAMQSLVQGQPARELREAEAQVLGGVGSPNAQALVQVPFALNDVVARELGLSPSFTLLQSAELLSEDAPGAPIDLQAAVERAIDENRSLRAERMTLASVDAERKQARAPLMPQVVANAQGYWIDEDRAAGPFPPSERQISVGGTASQMIYSARSIGDNAVARYDRAAAGQVFQSARLDLVQDVANRYIELMRSQVALRIAEQRVRSARANLALAEGRERAGDVGRDEVFRWRVDLANGQQQRVRAKARVQQAAATLNEAMSYDPERAMRPRERDGSALAMVATDERLEPYFDSPTSLTELREFSVSRALEAAPELAAARTRIKAAARARKRELRSMLTPDVALEASLTGRVWRDGAGSQRVNVSGLVIPDNFDWSVGVVASLPLFEGLGQQASLDRATAIEKRAEAREEALVFAIERQVYNALQAASAAYQATALATDAAAASAENLELVRDAYARGSMDVIRLVDAQSQAFTTELNARDAYHDFLTAFVAVERNLGRFSFGPDALEPDAFFQALAQRERAGAQGAP